MKSFLVIGLSRFGTTLARNLYSLGNEVMVLDTDDELIQRISDDVTHAVAGDAREEAVLRSVGALNFDTVIVSISRNIETSTLVTLQLKEMGVESVLSVAQSDIHVKLLSKVGADRVILPEKDMGERIAQSLTQKNILDYVELSEDVSIVEIEVPRRWIGHSIMELEIRKKYRVNVIAVQNGLTKEIELSLTSEQVFEAGDQVFILGRDIDVAKVAAEK